MQEWLFVLLSDWHMSLQSVVQMSFWPDVHDLETAFLRHPRQVKSAMQFKQSSIINTTSIEYIPITTIVIPLTRDYTPRRTTMTQLRTTCTCT